MITIAQANFLGRAMKAPITAYGSDHKVAGNLRQGGLIREVGKGLSHSPLFGPTAAGLEALREFRAAKWAKRGCPAYLDELREVEIALS